MITLAQALAINEIVRKSGELLRKLSFDPEMRQPTRKGDGSPVTKADLLVSEDLVKALEPLGYLVVSEEALPEKPPGPQDSYFLVDPLDGTKYFARGENEFAVSVGLLINGEPTYGAIYDPTEQKLYWGLKGEGAYCDDLPIKHPGPSGPLRVYSSGFHKRPEKDKIVEALNIGYISEKGSALKFCDIAKGEIDLYMRFGPFSEWDTAGAQVILEEADCVLYEAKTLERLVYGKPKYRNLGVVTCHKSLIGTVTEFLKDNRPPIKKEWQES